MEPIITIIMKNSSKYLFYYHLNNNKTLKLLFPLNNYLVFDLKLIKKTTGILLLCYSEFCDNQKEDSLLIFFLMYMYTYLNMCFTWHLLHNCHSSADKRNVVMKNSFKTPARINKKADLAMCLLVLLK